MTTGSDSDLNETSLSRDVMAVDPVEGEERAEILLMCIQGQCNGTPSIVT